MPAPPFQSLYRRYRPRRFGEVRGQDHVVRAVRNAVRDHTVAHAYLFSGPRGTGKTSTARILAKVLNCTAPVEGEPCCECDSCLAVEAGTSFDVTELDAASHNGVDAMRDLVASVALGSGGRRRVYILDEVHMLSTAAANALLKTLEEPPAHVVFVLATTDPQKVLPTIRSRTQPFEFRLLPTATLGEHLRWVAGEAGLDLGDDAIDLAVRRGAGSARDSLTALDQIVAGGAVEDEAPVDELVEALCERDTGRALVAVATACEAGRDPRQLAQLLLAQLRDGFLSLMAPDLVALPDGSAARVTEQARRLGAAATVRALDAVGEVLVALRDAPDPRVVLEVALVRLTRPEIDTSPAALVERLERLERAARTPAPLPGETGPPGVTPPPAPPPPPGRSGSAPSARSASQAARAALGGVAGPPATTPPTGSAPTAPPASPSAPADTAPLPAPADTAPMPTRDELTLAWGDAVLGRMAPAARALFAAGRYVDVEGDTAVFALPNQVHRDRCELRRAEVEEALAAHFGRPVALRLTVDADSPGAPAGARPAPATAGTAVDLTEESIDLADLQDAPAAPSHVERLTDLFPGATIVDE